MPNASITADVIVGFPGESDKQFQNTLSVIEEIGFDQINTAAYSPRPNTPAAVWSNQLTEEIKVERLKEINCLVENIAKGRNARYKERVEEILVEGINPKDQKQLMGRTRTNRLTFFPHMGNEGIIYDPGDIVKVKIKEVRSFSLSGIPVSKISK